MLYQSVKCEGSDRVLVFPHILNNNSLHPEHQSCNVKDVVKVSFIVQSWFNLSNLHLRETLLVQKRTRVELCLMSM